MLRLCASNQGIRSIWRAQTPDDLGQADLGRHRLQPLRAQVRGEQCPGLGALVVPRDADHATSPFNHSPYATFDDGVLADGAALYAELAISRLAALAAADSPAADNTVAAASTLS